MNHFLSLLPLLALSMCQTDDITIRYDGPAAEVAQTVKDSVMVTVSGARVNVVSQYKSHKLTLRLTGSSDDGQLVLKTDGKARVTLDGLNLTSQEGAPLDLKNKKKVEVKAANGTENTLTVTACNDTANHKAAVIWSKDKLLLSGKGVLNVIATGDGCRGIKTKKDITIEDLPLYVKTSGNNLGEKPFGMGGFPGMPEGGFPGIPEGGFPFGNDSTMRGFPDFPGGMPDFGNFPGFPDGMPDFGDFPGFPEGMEFPDSLDFPGFPDGGFPDGDFPDFGGGFGGKHKYVASTKGIASKGRVVVNSGSVTVRTSTAGAEGIEGKEGIVFNGGNVDVLTPDDAINANGVIEFNGAHVVAVSTGNDAVDANPENGFFMPFGGGGGQDIEPTIIIRGGTVYAWSQVGSPEEGMDSDFAPIAIEGGTVFTVGGGMGEMPSVPTNETAKQPTVLLIGLTVTKDEPVTVSDSKGRIIDKVTIPFSQRRSATLVSSPAFKLGSTYSVKTQGYEKSFTLNDPFTIVR